jgi:hypothetical protein
MRSEGSVGTATKHLGVARTRLDAVQDFPVLFRVYAHQAWASVKDRDEVVFPPDAVFQVREVRSLPGDRMVFCLEQEQPGSGMREEVPAEFSAWLPGALCALATPDPALDATWTEPFARWDREAVPGDAPRLGVLYEPEGALRFVVDATGLAEEPVRRILDAMFRYLELAGTAQGEEADDLQRERLAMAHLLPEDPCDLDPALEMAYLQLATEQDAEVIRQVHNAELDYCRHLGLVEDPPEAMAAEVPPEDQGPAFQTDLEHGLWVIERLFRNERLPMTEVARDEEGAILFFTIGGDGFAVHLLVTRWEPARKDLGPVPALLTEVCRRYRALPLQLRVNLEPGEEQVWHRTFGDLAFQSALRSDRPRWKRHLLGGLSGAAWLERAGALSTLRIQSVEGGWPYALIDGKPVVLPAEGDHWCIKNPPLDPEHLCYSVTVDEEWWLFTCECSVAACGGIDSGVLVGHDDGLVVWRSREHPDLPMAVFEQRQYRKVILAAVKELLKNPPRYSGLNWGMAIKPEELRRLLGAVRAGRVRN